MFGLIIIAVGCLTIHDPLETSNEKLDKINVTMMKSKKKQNDTQKIP